MEQSVESQNLKKSISRRRNYLKKVLRVQQLYTEHHEKGVNSGYIFSKFIKDEFNIERSTFYEYLAVPATRELKKLSEKYPE